MFYVKEHALTEEIYRTLRSMVHFKAYDDEDVVMALQHSLYSVVIFDNDQPVGIARLVGDNRICFFLKDVVVDPRYQKLKVGRLLMKYLFQYISQHACEGAYIGLMSTPACVPFYEKFGFQQRPCDDMGPGMIKFYTKDEVIE